MDGTRIIRECREKWHVSDNATLTKTKVIKQFIPAFSKIHNFFVEDGVVLVIFYQCALSIQVGLGGLFSSLQFKIIRIRRRLQLSKKKFSSRSIFSNGTEQGSLTSRMTGRCTLSNRPQSTNNHQFIHMFTFQK